MSVSSPVRDLKLNDKTDMVSPTESTGRLDIPGIVALRKDGGKDDSKDDVRKELEMYNMKELMLIHLDYIQQQTEVAQIKDKLIADLQNQVETVRVTYHMEPRVVLVDLKRYLRNKEYTKLKQRLHRMTRRVSLTKGRSHSASNQNGVVGHKVATNGLGPATDAKAALGATAASLLRKKRHQSGLDGNLTSGEEPPLKKMNKLQKKDHLGSRLRRRTPSECSKTETDRSILNKLKTIWTTKETYTTIVGETESAMRWAGSSAADSETVSKHVPTSSKAALEVPKWRTHCYSPIYSMEGTEDLSDNVYDRKHEKLAADEKRRKRWDCQRIRELRVVERQREKEAQKEAARKNAREESSGAIETNSFWPEPPELGERLTLCVSDEVPIGFCGINLLPPSKEEQEFCLPWKNGGCEQPMKPRRRGKR